MNIFGRVLGGLLVLISLGWLASIAGIRPGGLASNQIDGDQQTGKTPVSTSKPGTQVGTSKFETGQSTSGQTTAGDPEVEQNPRDVTNPALPQRTSPVRPIRPSPIQAGW